MRPARHRANGLFLMPCGASGTHVKRCDPPSSLTGLFKREMVSTGNGSFSRRRSRRSVPSPNLSSRPVKTTILSSFFLCL